jgi:hypothetical protein
MERNLVLIVVSAYNLSGEQSEVWLFEEEVANRWNSEPCYQYRWAAMLVVPAVPNVPEGHIVYCGFPGELTCEQDCVQLEPVTMSERMIDPAMPCAWIPKNVVFRSG